MATSTVTRTRVRLAVNTPGGPVREAVRSTVRVAKVNAFLDAPVGDPGDYVHRAFRLFPSATGPAAPGTYKASFRTDIRGSRGSVVVGNLRNTADHAIYVELGRSTRGGRQAFVSANSFIAPRFADAFEQNEAARDAVIVTQGTATREGLHIMRDALRDAAAQVLGIGARGRSLTDIPARALRGRVPGV